MVQGCFFLPSSGKEVSLQCGDRNQVGSITTGCFYLGNVGETQQDVLSWSRWEDYKHLSSKMTESPSLLK